MLCAVHLSILADILSGPLVLLHGVLRFDVCENFTSCTEQVYEVPTLLEMSRYYNTTLCHYWDMSVK